MVGREGAADTMTLQCEVAGGDEALAIAVADSLTALCKLKGAVEFFEPGSLPNDGKVIDDLRSYD